MELAKGVVEGEELAVNLSKYMFSRYSKKEQKNVHDRTLRAGRPEDAVRCGVSESDTAI